MSARTQFYDLEKEFFQEFCLTPQNFISDVLKKDYKEYYLIENELLIGYVVYCFEVDSIHIITLGVREERRRQGIGQKLFEYVKCEIKPNHTYISCNLYETNLDGQLFLQKLGFKAYLPDDKIEHPDYYGFEYTL